ncbi:MAG TPA: hypothetical protein PK752_17325, partial [Accumulibacter sp.]|uniref:hypothetical protein n=1 Tax=Accumulibacter sp. TaxID=2053492 RepID=UPI002C5E0840
ESGFAHRQFHPGAAAGRQVHLRAGMLRPGYFAHNSHRADPACENYHPSVHERMVGGGSSAQKHNPYAEDFQCGVLLERSGASCQLQLRLPRLPEGSARSGRLWISTALRERPPYNTLNLKRRQRVPLAPALPLASVRGEDGLALWATVLAKRLEDFAETGNFFRAGEHGGRLMPKDAVLEWGGRYRALTRQAWSAFLPDGLAVEPLRSAGDWHAYEVTLPSDGVLGSAQEAVLAGFLGRRIVSPVPHAYFIDPAPHHYDDDGAAVFPATAGAFLLRVTGGGRVRVVSLASGADSGIVRDLAAGWCKVGGLVCGEFVVLVDEHPALFGSIETDLPVFLPDGVRLQHGEMNCELFEAAAAVRGDSGPLRVICPSERVAAFLALPAAQWTLSERAYVCHEDWPEVIDAGNFGVLRRVPVRAEPEPEPDIGRSTAPARNLWLNGALARHAAAYGAAGGATGVGPGEPCWLLPHIRHLNNGGSQRELPWH